MSSARAWIDPSPFDDAAATAAATARISLARKGSVIGPIDLLIAGTALNRGALLVTDNVREFSRVEGLRVVDWSSEDAAVPA